MAKSCIAVCFTYSVRMDLNTDISQGSVATCLGYGGGICTRLCYKFPTESNSERILKIGHYLVKLWARVRCLVFSTHSVYSTGFYWTVNQRECSSKLHRSISVYASSKQARRAAG